MGHPGGVAGVKAAHRPGALFTGEALTGQLRRVRNITSVSAYKCENMEYKLYVVRRVMNAAEKE